MFLLLLNPLDVVLEVSECDLLSEELVEIEYGLEDWRRFHRFTRSQFRVIVFMNKIKLPEFKGNNLLFHAVNHSNTIDCINLLESNALGYVDK